MRDYGRCSVERRRGRVLEFKKQQGLFVRERQSIRPKDESVKYT
jgi:hypothetical protein